MNDKTTVTPAGVIRAAAFELAADRVRVDLERYKTKGQTSIEKWAEAVFARQALEPLVAELEAWSNDELAGEPHTSKPRPKAATPVPTFWQFMRREFLQRPLTPREIMLFTIGIWLSTGIAALAQAVAR